MGALAVGPAPQRAPCTDRLDRRPSVSGWRRSPVTSCLRTRSCISFRCAPPTSSPAGTEALCPTPGYPTCVARGRGRPTDLERRNASLVGVAIGGGTSAVHQQLIFRARSRQSQRATCGENLEWSTVRAARWPATAPAGVSTRRMTQRANGSWSVAMERPPRAGSPCLQATRPVLPGGTFMGQRGRARRDCQFCDFPQNRSHSSLELVAPPMSIEPAPTGVET